ncbi:alternate-type signal peptide domain-containing protein [Rhodococcus sp. BP-349]|jgi:alternate signal-mediated exported protein|uniref:alternate-type signal peptide domain-containing protein n=1 Tax=unclassified Rhodococcus (in: high G+C Gram-positive bacteria) TaxID=192944 RepID=UPI001C9B7F22|nr:MULTISPECIES: alternate-type signal peptide domain-containing protein [unclassified Rhodococcus (in: high G+C Gram-positive bacteria)]MBY6539920.1 alternate-type signal peptide domain-containing protein [Rhodococcus sp. BP-363]MBY6543752.1 alternate-type signal peptide domain-containing protein [Rhodococcus sp. BP-369]MBY6562982.1 alternate-type signal peptide domain-containing protein [Rhodococcus sp. BP-370]MBY6577274.1 alternate-type signal peptide domain-containing protein [Rhodococcus s
MNKATKGAMAAGAAALLLLGGAGSYALWSDTETVVGGDINTGTLDITASPGTWTNVSSGASIPNINAFRMVPGDTVRYTTNVLVTAIGNNLAANVTVGTVGGPTLVEGPDNLGATDIGVWTAPPASVFGVTTSAAFTAGGPAVTRITSADNGKNLIVNADITFNANAQVGVNTKASFANFNVVVDQVRP